MKNLLSEQVHIGGRFLRSVRIDKDEASSSLEGYVFPESLKRLVVSFVSQQAESGQGAYIWTGPYGSGKSSLALALSALLTGTKTSRTKSGEALDLETANAVWEKLPPKPQGWRTLPLIGTRADAESIFKEGIISLGHKLDDTNSNPKQIISKLEEIAQEKSTKHGGLVIFLDEMGKLLEHASTNSGDVYFFQLLAEAAARSNGRLIFVGILHQSFQEYAGLLGKDARDEWAKVQGRFTDIPVNLSGEEQLELINRAISTNSTSKQAPILAGTITEQIQLRRPGFGESNVTTLKGSWPLHPATAALLGPISRRSYGQNQRSIFSFLSSSEPLGFQDFLQRTPANTDTSYLPADLWDYLTTNLAGSIAASPDSRHFSTALETLDVCRATGGADLEISLLKTIAILELVSPQSGLIASEHTLLCCNYLYNEKDIRAALTSLQDKKLILFKEYRGSFGIYEGSDFDIHEALETAYRELPQVDLEPVANLLPFQRVVAKRHYHQTGTYRYCQFSIASADKLEHTLQGFKNSNRAFGLIMVVIPTLGESVEDVVSTFKRQQKKIKDIDLLLTTSKAAEVLFSKIKEQAALQYILTNRPELKGDRIARREISDRRDAIANAISADVWQIVNNAEWHLSNSKTIKATWSDVNATISNFADNRFHAAPRIHNELLNRDKPSGSGNAAIKNLLHAMVLNEDQERLGFEKHPAEWGLYASVIQANNLHKSGTPYSFVAPKPDDEANLFPAWQAAKAFLSQNSGRSVLLSELYEEWAKAPYGINRGLMPVLAVLFILTEKSSLAFYREKIFLSRLSDVDVDYLFKAPNLIQLRWMEISETARDLLAGMADIAAKLSSKPVLDLEPIDVARALIAAFDNAPNWVQRTTRLSKNAIRIRTIFKKANDPNKFIFDDIPALYIDTVDPATDEGIQYVIRQIEDGLTEIDKAYEGMLDILRAQILNELQVIGASDEARADLRARAENIKGLSGDLRLEAFITRLSGYDNSRTSIESIASLAINKPPKDWLDTDLDQATVELVHLAQRFNKHETVARIKGRTDKREAMAVVVGMDGRPVHVLKEFDILDSERGNVAAVASRIEDAINLVGNVQQNVLLAALATVSARVIGHEDKEGEKRG